MRHGLNFVQKNVTKSHINHFNLERNISLFVDFLVWCLFLGCLFLTFSSTNNPFPFGTRQKHNRISDFFFFFVLYLLSRNVSLYLFVMYLFCFGPSGITNGGYENSINDNHTIMNKSAATTSPHRPTPRIMTVTSIMTTTTNYENSMDESNGLTQATIITEPYFDSQTPRNVTGLVGKLEKKIS